MNKNNITLDPKTGEEWYLDPATGEEVLLADYLSREKKSAIQNTKNKLLEGAYQGTVAPIIGGIEAAKNIDMSKGFEGNAQNIGAIAGGIGSAAGLAVAPVRGLVSGAIQGAGMNTLGINEALAKASETAQNVGNLQEYLPKGLRGSVAANLIAQIPGGIASTAIDVAPMLIGKNEKGQISIKNPLETSSGMKYLKPETRAMLKGGIEGYAPAQLSKAGQYAQELGITAGKSAEAWQTNQPKGKFTEAYFKATEPEQAANAYNRNVEELSKAFANITKTEAHPLGLENADINVIGAELDSNANARHDYVSNAFSNYSNNVTSLGKAPINGTALKTRLENFLQSKGVDVKNIDNTTQYADIPPQVAKELYNFINAADKLKGAKSIKQLLNLKQNFDFQYDTIFKDAPEKAINIKKEFRKIINDTIKENLQKLSPDVYKEGLAINEAWGKRADAYDLLGGVKGKMGFDNMPPAKKISTAINKGIEGIKALKEITGEQATTDAATKYIADQTGTDPYKMKKLLTSNKLLWENALGEKQYNNLMKYAIAGEYSRNPIIKAQQNVGTGAQTAAKLVTAAKGLGNIGGAFGITQGIMTGNLPLIAGSTMPIIAGVSNKLAAQKYYNTNSAEALNTQNKLAVLNELQRRGNMERIPLLGIQSSVLSKKNEKKKLLTTKILDKNRPLGLGLLK